MSMHYLGFLEIEASSSMAGAAKCWLERLGKSLPGLEGYHELRAMATGPEGNTA